MRPALLAALLLTACGAAQDAPQQGAQEEAVGRAEAPLPAGAPATLRVATFNASLYRDEAGQLARDLAAWTDPQLDAVAGVVAEVSPDILVLNEVDHDAGGAAVRLLGERLGYPYRLALPSNTGLASGFDLDGDGRSDHAPGSREYGGDAFGYGTHEGQYGIAVLSRLPLDEAGVRTWREALWRDAPGPRPPEGFYPDGALDVLRVSSKTHAVVPVRTGAGPLHLVLAHPTPPGFDGPEDRNGRRNGAEIALLHAIVDPERGVPDDDDGRAGGLARDALFVIAGDLNADPADGDGRGGPISDLLASPLVIDPAPRSAGGPAAAAAQAQANAEQSGDPALDTADFSDGRVGNLRVDYVLPSANMSVVDAGVFWPAEGEPAFDLVGSGWPVVSSDHRLVWVDLALPIAGEGGG